MARTATRRSSASKKRKGGKIKKTAQLGSKINLGRIFYIIALFFFLVFSVGMVGYVVFFRTVIAAELPFEEKDIIFEEPYNSDHEPTSFLKSEKKDEKLPTVAIIIDDMGYHHDTGEELINLDLNLSFSFLPYAPFTKELEEVAYQQGKTILLHLPMEPRSPEWDPGPNALYLSGSKDEHQEIFTDSLAMVPHATGVNTHMGSKYSENLNAMDELAGMLADRELFFIDSFTTPSSKGLKAARDRGVPSAKRHIFLDNVQKQKQICNQLQKLVSVAKQHGGAIGIGHPYPETLKAITHCGPEILVGVRLAGADEMVQ